MTSEGAAKAAADPVALMKGIALVMAGCCANVIFLEYIIKLDPGSGNLITAAQFAFVAGASLLSRIEIANGRLALAPRAIPLRRYLEMVALFCFMSTINNKAMAYNIGVPFHITFRSASLLANMVFDFMLTGKRYTWQQVMSVLMVTVGIITATLASAEQAKALSAKKPVVDSEDDFHVWLQGVAMLTIALCTSSLLGILQENTYRVYGRGQPSEGVFYSHALSLPFFLVAYEDIMKHALVFVTSEPLTVHLGESIAFVAGPVLLVYLAGNVVTQLVCANGVYTVTTNSSSLTMTLVLTVRKFVSLIFSIFYFNNEFTVQHWVGTAVLTLGTIFYVLSPKHPSPEDTKKEKAS